jgi:hypothetical protein
MRAILFLLLILSLNSQAQLVTNVSWTEQSSLKSSDVVYYDPSSPLQWDDFQGPHVEGGLTAAVTVSGFGYKAGIKHRNGKGVLNIDVYCYFQKRKSWVKPGKDIPYILTHEQNHFDISYIAANIFIEKLRRANFTSSNFEDLIPRIYNESCDIMNKMQDDYDGQTHNGRHQEEQEKWNSLVDEKLEIITK